MLAPPLSEGAPRLKQARLLALLVPAGLLGGALGTWIGLRPTLVIGATGAGLSFLWILLSPQRHLREMPEPLVDEPVTEELGPVLPGVVDPLAPADAT